MRAEAIRSPSRKLLFLTDNPSKERSPLSSKSNVGKIPDGHGLLNPAGPEAGDIPNIWAAADGSAGYEAFTTLITGAELADEDGTAMIIHANRDDHLTQPIGGAGPRVACAVIR